MSQFNVTGFSGWYTVDRCFRLVSTSCVFMYKEALYGLAEAIRLNPDSFCVVHTLAALCHILLSAVPWEMKGAPTSDLSWDPSETLFLLKKCMARVTAMRLPHLVVFCRMALTKFSLKYGMAVSEAKQ